MESVKRRKEVIDEAERVRRQMVEAEIVAEDILIDKDKIVAFDRARNKNREALRAIADSQSTMPSKMWLCFGDMFIKVPSANAQQIIKKDQARLDAEINSTRDKLKEKMSKLSAIEGTKDPASSFYLKSINMNELNLKDFT